MKLLIKTPFVDQNKFIPHLVEHCISDDHNTEDFPKYTLELECCTRSGYSEVERDTLSLDEVITKISAPFPESTFQLELSIIKKELRNTSFWQKSYEKLIQKLIHPNIKTNSYLEVSYQEISNYHKQRYSKDNIILLDHNDQIDLSFGKGKKLQETTLSITNFHLPNFFSFTYQGELNTGYTISYKTAEDILILDFFWDLLNSYQYAIFSKEKKQYYSDFFNYSFTDSHFIISYDGDFPKINLKKLKLFFPSFQTYATNRILSGKFNSRKWEIALFLGKTYTKEEHKKLIESIDFSLINDLLNLSKSN